MARKTNLEKDKAVSVAPTKARRKATPAQLKRSAAAAETSVSSSIEDFETEVGITVSATEAGLTVSETETGIAVSSEGESAGPSRKEIERLAYHYWLDRGEQHGSAEQDWLRAERDLRHGTTTVQ